MKCLKAGLYTTVQDIGRNNYESYGFSVAGAMSQYLYKIATALVDNENSAALEITKLGPTFIFNESNVIAFASYGAQLYIDHKEVPINTAIYIEKGQILEIRNIEKGSRGYLAFQKSLDIDKVLNSYATHTRSGIGGFKGRTIQKGDHLKFKKTNINHDVIGNTVTLTPYEHDLVIPIIEGLQFDSFTEAGKKLLTKQKYEISNLSDRMGVRLIGKDKITHKTEADIISEPITAGSIQIPNSGQPIILMNDRQTIGGYTKIANVTFIGQEKLANVNVGDEVTFKWTTIEQAQTSYASYFKMIEQQIFEIKNKKNKNIQNIRPKSEKISNLIKGE